MSSFGEGLASLYNQIRSENAERAQAAAERTRKIAEMANETHTLLNGFIKERGERMEDFVAMSHKLRQDLSDSAKKLKSDVADLQAEAREQAENRANHREAMFGDLRTRLSMFSEKLQSDTATQFAIARKAYSQAQAIQDVAASAIKTSIENVYQAAGVVPEAPDTQKTQNKGAEKEADAGNAATTRKKFKTTKDQ